MKEHDFHQELDIHPFNALDRRLHELAEEYHRRAEEYDRTVCTGVRETMAVPMNSRESALINKHAMRLRWEIATRERLTDKECAAFQKALFSFPRMAQ